MFIKSVTLNNFRNISLLDLKLGDKNFLIYGPNGVGKTSLIEAIHISIKGFSFRTDRIAEIIKYNEEFAQVETEFFYKDMKNIGVFRIHKGRFKHLINEIKIPTKDKLKYPVIVMTGKERNLVSGPPSLRRRYVDSLLMMIDMDYGEILGMYLKSLKQRNALLKDGNVNGIDVWEDMMVKYGKIIREKRVNILMNVESIANKIYGRITGNSANIKISYLKNGDNIEDLFSLNREKDIKYGYTTQGPHRDDILILLNGMESKKFASMGELMSIAISLKLSSAHITLKRTDEKILFLLDDVLAEVDEKRGENILNIISSYGKFFLTSTKMIKGVEEIINMG